MDSSYDIALLPGDGIGIEILRATTCSRADRDSTGIQFNIDEIPCGGQYYLEHGADWPEDGEARCRAADVILLGAVGWPSPESQDTSHHDQWKDGRVLTGHRKPLNLNLYANIRPVKLFDGVKTRISGERKAVWKAGDVDMVFLRENTEGLYSGTAAASTPAVKRSMNRSVAVSTRNQGDDEAATDTRLITRTATERVIRKAFEIAMQRDGAPKDGQKRVTCIVKNNVMDAACSLRSSRKSGRSTPRSKKTSPSSTHSPNG